MENQIQCHNSLYLTLFNDSLKPKYHFLVHYPGIIRKCGPLKYLWCFRLEAGHQIHKQYARNITSRINIPFTLAIKASLKFANLVLTNKVFQNEFPQVRNTFYCKERDTKYLPLFNDSFTSLHYTNELIFHGKKLKVGYYFYKNRIISNIYKIIDLIYKDFKYFAICNYYSNNLFLTHYHCWLIGNQSENFNLIDLDEIGPAVNSRHLNDGREVVRMRVFH